MRNKWLMILVTVMASATLWGCGSGGSGGSTVTSSSAVSTAEETGNCTICHTVQVHTGFDGIAGAHPDYPAAVTATNYLGEDISHDCEDCHGGGQYHHGVGPIPYPDPNLDRCAECHTQSTKVLASAHNFNTEGDAADAIVEAGEHYVDGVCIRCHTAEGFFALKDVTGTETDLDAGYDAAVLAGTVPDSFDANGNSIIHNPVCGACHNPLTKEMRTADPAWTPNGSTSAQLALCTECHNYKMNDGTIMATGNTYTVSTAAGVDDEWFTADDTLSAGTNTALIGHHDTSWYRIIATTHFDNPDSTDVIEGYNIKEDSASACFDCHGHELKTNTHNHAENDPSDPAKVETIHTQWAASAHAGHLLTVKETAAAANPVTGSRGTAEYDTTGHAQVEAVLSVGATEETGAAWVHYNWDDNDSRSACQMCHTATGAANFMTDPANYDPANNDYSHLDSWNAVGGSPQNELLYCWGCHSNVDTGALRTPGPITLAYTADGADITMPDLGDSNVCINCHSGRGNMDSLVAPADVDPAGPAVTGGTKTHYLTAGATIFQSLTKIGYEYAGASYADKSYFAHDSLGCAECHMGSEANHTFEVVEKNNLDEITAIKSDRCVSCHDGEHALFVAESLVGTTQNIWNGTAAVPTTVTQTMADDAAAELELEAAGYHKALEALAAELTTAGTAPKASYPYFDGASTDQGHGGAMHNYSYLHHEPGAYAHNRYYAKRLIFDSIDWLTDADGTAAIAGSRALDGQITLDPVTYAEAIEWLGGNTTTGVIDTRP